MSLLKETMLYALSGGHLSKWMAITGVWYRMTFNYFTKDRANSTTCKVIKVNQDQMTYLIFIQKCTRTLSSLDILLSFL